MKKLILLLSFASCISFTNAQSWQTVGSAGFSSDIANTLCMAIDGNGTPYVLYGDGGVDSNKANVVKYNGSSWVAVGSHGFSAGGISFSAIAIDGSGTPYVSYFDAAYNQKATVMKYNGSSWVNVGSPGFSAGEAPWTSIAIDGGGTPYVVYSDNGTNGKATVMKFNGTAWVPVGGSPGISAGAVAFTTIAIDRSGTPYVAYCDVADSQKTTVMKYNGSSWVTVGNAGFSAGEAHYTSIAIDSDGTPYVAYSDYGNGQKATLMKYNGTAWVAQGGAGFSLGEADYTVLAIDHNNIPYVAYEDYFYADKATVMKYNGSSWVSVGNAGFSPSFVFNSSMAIDNNGTPYMVYDDGASGDKATVMNYSTPAAHPPVASFQSSDTSFCSANCVNFTDRSSNATSWQWTFQGANPSSSTVENPQNICYTAAGNYDVTLVASNNGGSDTLRLSSFIKVIASPPTPVITQSFDTLFCSTDPSYAAYQWYDTTSLIMGATGTYYIASQDGNFNVRVTNESGCNTAAGINVVITPNGIPSYSSDGGISIYPNPAEDKIMVYSTSGNYGITRLRIYNVLGEIVQSQSLSFGEGRGVQRTADSFGESIDISSLPSGIYFVQIENENGSWVDKIVKH